ncbi:MAG TPA: hypothetical protein VGA72_16405, partial [Anaerolineales bacterium]
SLNRMKPPSTRALTVRCTSEVTCGLQAQVDASSGRIHALHYVGADTPKTSPFMMGVIAGSDSIQRNCPEFSPNFP